MASSMKSIKLRIKSVESTMQITKAMEMVASSKLRRARDRVERSRPYFDVLRQTLDDIIASNTEFSSRYLKTREIKRTCCIVIGGDRGLAGGYNANVFKKAAAELAGKNAVILPIGKRAVEYFERRQAEILTKSYSAAEEISVSDCFQIVRMICKGYLAGEYDEIKLIYTDFVSMLTQTPTVIQLLPFEKAEKRESAGPRSVIYYDPSSEAVFDAMIPEYLAGVLYGAMCESSASEQGARRTAMESASKNAGEIIENLSLYYNRARQAAITQEITEIVAGAEN